MPDGKSHNTPLFLNPTRSELLDKRHILGRWRYYFLLLFFGRNNITRLIAQLDPSPTASYVGATIIINKICFQNWSKLICRFLPMRHRYRLFIVIVRTEQENVYNMFIASVVRIVTLCILILVTYMHYYDFKYIFTIIHAVRLALCTVGCGIFFYFQAQAS